MDLGKKPIHLNMPSQSIIYALNADIVENESNDKEYIAKWCKKERKSLRNRIQKIKHRECKKKRRTTLLRDTAVKPNSNLKARVRSVLKKKEKLANIRKI